MNLPAPLALSKKDTPRGEAVAKLLTTTLKTISKGAPTLKTRQAIASFWTALTYYAQRNLAEVDGAGTAPAAAPESAPKTKKVKAAPETAGQTATA